MRAQNTRELDNVIVDPLTYADEALYHDVFARLRRDDPVHWVKPDEYRPFWAVTKHADIVEVESQPKRFINDPRQFLVTKKDEELLQAQTGGAMFARNLVAMDDPDHKLFRGLTAAWFQPKSLKALEGEIRDLARLMVDRMVELGGKCDFVSDIASWYPLRTIMLVLGVPVEDEALMLRLSKQVFGNTDPDTSKGDGMASMLDAFQQFSDYFTTITEDRRAKPREDVASVLANAVINGQPIGQAELNAYYLIIAAAGHDTTSSSIAGGLLALIENPAELTKLQADPALMGRAADEFIRWTTPVKHFFRTATEDCELRGRQIRAGDSLMMCYPSANRDEDAFVEPFAFRIDRAPNRHVAFGYGPHVCLGQYLAKLEIRFLFEELLARLEGFGLAGSPDWVKANFVSGLKTLPITYSEKAEKLEAQLGR
jgi:cytochrome P450